MRGLLLLSIAGSIVFASTAPLFIHLFKLFISEKENHNALVYYIPLAIVLLAVVRGVGSFISTYSIGKIGENITHKLRSEFFNKLLYLPRSFFDSYDSGKLISVITYNINQVNEAASKLLLQLLQEGLLAIALLSYMLWLSWELSLIFLVIGLPIGFLSGYIGKKIRTMSSNVQNSMGDLVSVAKEGIEANLLIRCYHGEEMESKRFNKISFSYLKNSIKLIQANATLPPIIHLLIAFSIALVMYGILLLYSDGTPADIIAYIMASAGLPGPIRALSNSYGKILRSIVAAASIFKILDQKNEIDNGRIDALSLEGNIEIKDLSFRYPKSSNYVLSNINLKITKGETVAFVGASGSGKTTLVSVLMRFYQNIEGQILLDGVPLEHFTIYSLRNHFALVNQNITLFNTTLYDNIAFGELNIKTEEQVLEAAQIAYVDEFAVKKSKGYQMLVGENGNNLSGGQRQRVAIARAILKDAPVLILDEATSALDRVSERKIKNAIDKMITNRTTIIIAHRLSTITKADRIVVMDQGRIVEIGSHKELLTSQGKYANLFKTNYFKDE